MFFCQCHCVVLACPFFIFLTASFYISNVIRKNVTLGTLGLRKYSTESTEPALMTKALFLSGPVSLRVLLSICQDHVQALSPERLACVRPDVRVPATASQTCTRYSDDPGLSFGLLHPPSEFVGGLPPPTTRQAEIKTIS